MKNLLIPYAYRVRSGYKTDKYYKSTFTALIAIILAAGLVGTLTYIAKKKETDYNAKAARIDGEKKTIETHQHRLNNTIAGYEQIQKWAPHRRLPCSPMLDWVEKHVPPEQAVTDITFNLDPFTPGKIRKGTFGLDVYLDPTGGTNVPTATTWVTLAGTSQEFTSSGLSVTDVKLSPSKHMGSGILVHVDIHVSQKKDL